jgi:colanic acid/amylovoran biosynthesis glycosyltransferase
VAHIEHRGRRVTAGDAAPPTGQQVAYLMSRFPRLTETFILYEILALRRRGLDVQVYPLMRERKTRVHPDGASTLTKAVDLFSGEDREILMHAEARMLLPYVHYGPLFSWEIARSVGRVVLRRPLTFLATIGTVVRRNLGSANYLLGGLAIVPKSVHLGAEMRRAGVTHLHAHFANHPTTAAYVIQRLFDIPFSFTGHGADLQVDQHMLRQKVAAATFVRAISHDGRRFIISHAAPASPEKVVVVPCGVDTAAFAGQHRLRERGSSLRLLCIATLYEVKGHRYLFDAIALLAARGVDVRCRLVGDGPDRLALEAIVADLGISNRIDFLGQRTREEIIGIMHEADLLVVPSIPTASGRREGLPVVIIEAMSAGLPVVASAISGIPELVEDGHTGLLVPPKDAAALADAIVRLQADDQLRHRMVAAALARVRERYDFAVVSKALVELFTGIDSTGLGQRDTDGSPAASRTATTG